MRWMILLSVCLGLFNSARGEEQPPRLNVVFILADDLGWGDLGCYGQTKIRTPHIDRLASQGMRFTNAYSGAPVCAPSRCVLMTGLHLGHAQVRGNKQATGPDGKPTEGQYPLRAGTMTLPLLFQQAGYVTAAFGKWGLGPVGSTGSPEKMGIEQFYGYNCQAVAHSLYPSHLWRNSEHIRINRVAIPGHAKQPEGDVRFEDWETENHAPTLMEAAAVQFLKENASRPFFLYLPFIEPHVSLQPPRRLVETYPTEWDDRPYRGQCGYTPHPRPRAAYAAMVTNLDEHVGAVLDTLDQLGLTEKTLVIFSSDNGATHQHAGDPQFGVGGADTRFFNSTGGLREYKGSVHEGGIRVPLIVRWPGQVQSGAVTDFPTYFPDQLPTLCAAAGIPFPPGLDGVNLIPQLKGQSSASERNPMVWVFPEYGGQVAVRLGHLKAVRTNLNRPRQMTPWQVYDLAQDPGEKTDLAAQHPEVIETARRILREQMPANEVFPVNIPDL